MSVKMLPNSYKVTYFPEHIRERIENVVTAARDVERCAVQDTGQLLDLTTRLFEEWHKLEMEIIYSAKPINIANKLMNDMSKTERKRD